MSPVMCAGPLPGRYSRTSVPVLSTLAELMGVSRFLWEDFLRMQHENLFPVPLDLPGLEEPKIMDRLRESLQGRLSSLRSPPSGSGS